MSIVFSLLNMFNLRLYNTETIWYSLSKFGHIHRCDIDYIDHQLCGITILVPPVCLTAGGNLCQCQYKASNYIWRTSRDFSRPSNKLVWSTITFVLSQSTIRLGSANFSLVPMAVWHQSGSHANQYPACNHCVLSSWSFSERDVENYWSCTRCHRKSSTSCLWEQ